MSNNKDDTKKKEENVGIKLTMPELDKFETFEAYRSALEGYADSPSFPEISERFYAYEPERGKRQTLSATPEGEVKIVGDKAVVSAIMKHSRNYSHGLTFAQAKEAQEHWLWGTTGVSEIKIIALAEDKALAWRKVPFVLRPGPYPTFQEMFGRMTNSEEAMAYIGSLLVPESDRQQYWYLRGEGEDGKGALGRFLVALMGQSAQTMANAPNKDDKFLGSPMLGKRLIICNDLEANSGIVTSGFFKSITGGDSIFIQFKGKDGYTVTMDCKFVLMSNFPPRIEDTKADTRRLVYSEISKFDGEPMAQSAYDAQLWGEGPFFLHECLRLYQQKCPGHSSIKMSEAAAESVSDLIGTRYTEETALFEKYLVVDEDSLVDSSTLENVIRCCYPNDFGARRRFRAWMLRAYKLNDSSYRDHTRGELDKDGRPKKRKCVRGVRLSEAANKLGLLET